MNAVDILVPAVIHGCLLALAFQWGALRGRRHEQARRARHVRRRHLADADARRDTD